MATKTRGAPYPLGSDPNDAAGWIDQLAAWSNERPGVSALTTTQRNALTGVDLWDGRVVLNTTTDRLNRYDLGTTTWIVIPDNGDIGALLATTGTPADLGTASRGVSSSAARADHVHGGGTWINYTPVLAGATAGTTGSMLDGRYQQIGKGVIFHARWKLGTGFTIGTGANLSLPVARATYNSGGASTGADQGATVIVLDSGTSNYALYGYLNGATVSVWVPGTNGALVAVSSTVPFTWAAGDEIWINGAYEAA